MARPPPSKPSNHTSTPADLFTPAADRIRSGGAAFDPPPLRALRGQVVAVDAANHTYVVAAEGRRLSGVVRLRTHEGDASLLAIGTLVRVDFATGAPNIVGVYPSQGSPNPDDVPTLTGQGGYGGGDPLLNRNQGGVGRNAVDPRDLLPGDAVLQSPDGAAVAALHGKSAMLVGSPLAQVRQLDLIGGTLRILTWMGESRYENDGGATSFRGRGGAQQLDETGPGEERYTIRLDAGAAGDMVKFAVTLPDGRPVFRFHVSPEGRLEIRARGGVAISRGSAGDHLDRYDGGHEYHVEGPLTHRVTGAAAHEFGTTRETSVAQDDTHHVGQDATVFVNRNAYTSVGGDRTTQVTGGHTTRCDHHLTEAVTGDLTLRALLGNVKIDATRPDSVQLTGNPTSHVTKYEELEARLTQLVNELNALKTQLRAHTHPVPALGTSSPSADLQAIQDTSIDWSPAKCPTVQT